MENYYDFSNLPNLIPGVDSCYFFYESNTHYNDFFIDLVEQLEKKKKGFEDMSISYENRDLKVSINNQVFEFNGKAQGFYWFTHLENIFTVGFKDHYTNEQVHDIQVQLNAIGIYEKLGFKKLLEYSDNLFKSIVTGYKPVTRVDLNIFAQADLSWMTKDMFVSRKRKYITHVKEMTSKYRLETLYIGKIPFRLRLYDKKLELQKSSKNEMMYNYFETYGFNREDDIFNIEFEMHRTYLRSFGIDTVDDMLGFAKELFTEAMESIRLVDLSTISNKTLKNTNRYKAETHPLWQHISDSYKLKDFLAFDKPLIKQKRKKYLYTVEEAIKEHIDLAKRAYLNDVVIDEQFYSEVIEVRKNEYKF
jgi:hypothetical protein